MNQIENEIGIEKREIDLLFTPSQENNCSDPKPLVIHLG